MQGSLGGEYIRKSLNLNSWEAASDLVRLVRSWEASVGVVKATTPTIKDAVEKWTADGQARNLNAESVKKTRDAVERLFLAFCAKQGYRLLKPLGVDEIREFRNSLVKKYAASSAQTRLEYVRGFLRFCQGSGWIAADPALSVKPPKSNSSPTSPFEEGEIERMLAAADTFTVKGNFGAGNSEARPRHDPAASVFGPADLRRGHARAWPREGFEAFSLYARDWYPGVDSAPTARHAATAPSRLK